MSSLHAWRLMKLPGIFFEFLLQNTPIKNPNISDATRTWNMHFEKQFRNLQGNLNQGICKP